MLSGEAPFADQKGGMAKMWAQVNAEPRPLRERRPDVPAGLEEITRRAMSKTAEARPTAAAFRASRPQAVGATS